MSRRHDPTKARRHWVYTREQVCRRFSVGDSTITNWIGRGLRSIDDKRPQLFAGYEIRRFITGMRWPYGRSPVSGRLFCSVCPGFKALKHGSIKAMSIGIACYEVTGLCINCHNIVKSRIKARGLPEIYEASTNTARDSSDVISDEVSGGVGRSGVPVPVETNSFNLRVLQGYIVYLENHQNLDVRTVDEHLRALARMSAFFGHKDFEKITIEDACSFKGELRSLCSDEGRGILSLSTVLHTLDRCRVFIEWLERQADTERLSDLAGYFSLSRRERAIEASTVKGTSLTFDQALCIFSAMPNSSPIDLRNRAIVAMFIITGMRIAALITLRGKHVNMRTRWVNQDPREVNTKLSKHIRTYLLDLGSGFLEALDEWVTWRNSNGFGHDAAFFLPDRYIQPNALGFGYKEGNVEIAECWKSEEPVQRLIKEAANLVGILSNSISSHDFRKVLHPFLIKRGEMTIKDEVALQLNFGHTPQEVIRKHYSFMQDSEREEVLDELCRRALTSRSELDLYLAYERKEISEKDADFRRAKEIFERNMYQRHKSDQQVCVF
ncbi:site-specific integrase [Pseudochrobactrum saccharolyticum]|uniref:site-specific integrase n=1 Tax=Pseudochrobactrum saccharolyticum TaxID=354352 RepID=UPI00275D2398|nr:tyrosine-type recombinase/integrase [Pseudochrobactrum saccharolyticum]MDP8252604.1 tyrosine-type recombinase/integrase [Pseudochrobactrum saccharolyticum]